MTDVEIAKSKMRRKALRQMIRNRICLGTPSGQIDPWWPYRRPGEPATLARQG